MRRSWSLTTTAVRGLTLSFACPPPSLPFFSHRLQLRSSAGLCRAIKTQMATTTLSEGGAPGTDLGVQVGAKSALLERIVEQTRKARQSGTLQTIPTRCHLIEDPASAAVGGPMQFPVRIKNGVYNKPDVLADNLGKRDPFVPPYEQDLFVEWGFSAGPADSPDAKHVILLNKYNVLPNHALIVTTQYESQTEPLNEADFDVFWQCVDELKGFGFYNCGANAGPSQPHKHMQVVPLPLEDGTELPLLRVLDQFALEEVDPEDNIACSLPTLRFEHSFCRLPKHVNGKQLLALYEALLSKSKLKSKDPTNNHHNVLLSQSWMMVVPRTQEGFDGLSGNGLVFAGIFFTKDQELCDKLATIGATNFLIKLTS